MTETAPPVGDRKGILGASEWTRLGLWLVAWNAAAPIRLVSLMLDPKVPVGYVVSLMPRLLVDHTLWALVTYAMFHLALRARREPLRQVLSILGVLAIPLMVVRYLTMMSFDYARGAPGRPPIGTLWFTGPAQMLPLIGAAAFGLLIVYMQREQDNAVLQANLQAELASARLQTLRLQLNPHFLFNALNSIASLVPNDAAKADTAIAALSSFLRASLSVTRGEETTLENELRLVDAYLEIESLRFEWLTVDLDVPDALRSAYVPAFVLQLLVENAIRHGLAPRGTPGRVQISARVNQNRLALCVSDDGIGFREASGDSSLGIGLKNIRARLAQLHGFDASLTIEHVQPHGTVATIHIPYRPCSLAKTDTSNG